MAQHQRRVMVSYIKREQLLVEMEGGTIVADHPPRLGGDGRGPTAGELLLMAMVASTIQAAGTVLGSLLGTTVEVVARSSFQSERERVDGPLTTIASMSTLHQRLEVRASDDADSAMLAEALEQASRCPVGSALRRGVEIDERFEVSSAPGSADRRVFSNEVLRADDLVWRAHPPGHREVSEAEAAWRVSAAAVGAGIVLVQQEHQRYAVAAAEGLGAGPTPNDLFIASLAACTAYYLAHNGRIAGIAVEDITVEAVGTVDDTGVVTSIVRTARVTGRFSDAEREALEHMSAHCYIGESMRRGVEVRTEVVTTRSRPGLGGAGRAEALDSLTACGDGSCCVPEPLTEPATRGATR